MIVKRISKAILSKLGLLEYGIKSFARVRGFDLHMSEDGVVSLSKRKGNSKQTIRIARRHSAYIGDMINYFEYYFNAVSPEIGIEEIVDYSLPKEHILKHSGVKFFFTSLPESDETTLVYLEKAKLQEGMVVFDLGAYCGASSYFFSKAVGPKGCVFSFEPDEENYSALQRNIRTHSLNNVSPVKKGIWSTSSTLAFQSEGNMGSSVQSIVGRNSNTTIIEVLSLEDAFRESGASKIDFIKMDVEGAEVEALNGGISLLRTYKPKIVVEPHYRDGKMNTGTIWGILEQIGYDCELLSQGSMDFPLIYAE